MTKNALSKQHKIVDDLAKKLKFETEALNIMIENERIERAEMLKTLMTQEWIDLLTPKHGRTSCSDENLNNAESGRCNRCVLMMAHQTGDYYGDFDIEINITKA